MRSVIRCIVAAAGLSVLGVGAASAQLPHNLQVKVGVSAVLPDESASVSLIGGDVDISDEYVPTLQLEWFFTDNISAELLCCMARHDVVAKGTALGDVNLGKISHFPPTLTLKYHFNTEQKLQPYLGAGINYTLFFDDKVPSGGAVTSVDYDPSFGGALQAGVDYKLDDHWSLNADVRKVWINSDVTIMAGATRVDADVDINPLIVTLGAGYRF